MHIMSYELAVVVPAFNEEAGIEDTLNALYGQDYAGDVLHVVVDNNSTDGTRPICEQFTREHTGFQLAVIDESEKGTGRAVDTGFQYAIDRGAPIIARTDADTLPTPSWTNTILANFGEHPDLKLLGGKRIPRQDEWYRQRDAVLWPLGIFAGRCIAFNGKGTGRIIGSNMATDATAYKAIGGIPRTSIEVSDEDREYERKMRDTYGKGAIREDPHMIVSTSMRRLREFGYLGHAKYRLSPTSRQNLTTVDIRATVPQPVHVSEVAFAD
jgi:glycosyltransferase involved in cell wall biosynthesis